MSKSPAITARTAAALLLLLISFGAANSNVPGLPIQPNCPVPVCGYGGKATFQELIGDDLTIHAEADITWTFSHMSGRQAVYTASGTVTVSWSETHCDITLEPSNGKLDPDSPDQHSRLNIDWTTVPVRYSAYGSSEWEGVQTWKCGSSEPFTQEGISAVWMRVHEGFAADPSNLSGSEQSELVQSTWNFSHGY